MLRQFLYLDDALTRQFLSQLEGGIFDEESQTLRSSSGSKLEGGVSAGVVRGGGGRNAEDEEAVSPDSQTNSRERFSSISHAS